MVSQTNKMSSINDIKIRSEKLQQSSRSWCFDRRFLSVRNRQTLTLGSSFFKLKPGYAPTLLLVQCATCSIDIACNDGAYD